MPAGCSAGRGFPCIEIYRSGQGGVYTGRRGPKYFGSIGKNNGRFFKKKYGYFSLTKN